MFSLEKEILERHNKYAIYGRVLDSETFIDIGIPDSYAAAQNFFDDDFPE